MSDEEDKISDEIDLKDTFGKFDASIKLFAEVNNLCDEADKLFDESDRMSDEEDKISDEIDLKDTKYESLYEESDEATPEMSALLSETFKLRKSLRESGAKRSKIGAEGRALNFKAATLKSSARKLFLEGMIEWKEKMAQLCEIKPPPR